MRSTQQCFASQSPFRSHTATIRYSHRWLVTPSSFLFPLLHLTPGYGALPTPSPEFEPHPSRHVPSSSYEPFIHNQAPSSWDGVRSDPRAPNRNKRSFEYNVDDFFTDMKKRKVNPAYDARAFIPSQSFMTSHLQFGRHG